MKLLVFVVLFFTVGTASAQYQFKESAAQFMSVDTFRIDPFETDLFTIGNFWLNQYPLVIVINKSKFGASKQSLRMYENGKLIFTTAVSTGRERWEKQKQSFFGKGPTKTYFSSTNQGYFRVRYLSADHQSKLWGTKMPWAIFFNEGIAIHEAPIGTEAALGSRASGGCVRISKRVAQGVFAKVKATGTSRKPAFTRSGEVVLDSRDQVKTEKGWNAVVVVEDVIE
jgi:hypothetical protein